MCIFLWNLRIALTDMKIFITLGTLLMPAGAILNAFDHTWGTVVYATGVAIFVYFQARHFKAPGDKGRSDVRQQLRRLRLWSWVSLGFLLGSAVLMGMQAWDYDRGEWLFPYAHRNAWVALCLAGALQQLYVHYRLEQLRRHLMLLLPLGTLFFLGGCTEGYMVQGRSNIRELEGKMLYLKIYDGEELKNIDSSRVTHGQFAFKGRTDSAVMVNLFAEQMSLMPIVLENLPLHVCLNDTEQKVSGSELNDTLCAFIHRKSRLDGKLAELPRKEGRMVMDGVDFDQVAMQLNMEYARLSAESDELVVSFIKRNYYNALGPGVFMIMTSNMPYPILTPRIEEIAATAPETFLQQAYVRDFLKKARENSNKLRD